jgi:hypothetical protein
MKTTRKWHKGPPPHVGWWNASVNRFEDCWRWWDGKQWSKSAWEDEPSRLAASASMMKQEPVAYPVEWTDYYPENARVPRINPEAK